MLARTRQDRLKLSDRVWRTSENARSSIQHIVEDAVVRGQDARTTAKQVQQYLQPGVFKPHKLETRRRLGVSTDVSYQAMRLARTEMNDAFHEGMIAANQHNPGYLGVFWRLSGSHFISDVCTDMAADMSHDVLGFYPKGKEPVRPHPNCMCIAIPAYEDLDQFVERLREWHDNPQLHPDIDGWYNQDNTRQILGHALEKVAIPEVTTTAGVITVTIDGLKITYGGTMPKNLRELVTRLDSTDNRVVGKLARKEEDKGDFKAGIINVVKKAIQGRNSANQTIVTSATSREDLMLRTRDSTGKATARR